MVQAHVAPRVAVSGASPRFISSVDLYSIYCVPRHKLSFGRTVEEAIDAFASSSPPPPPTRRPLLPDLVPARFPFDGVFPPHVHKVLAAAFVIAKDTLREYRFSVKYFQTARELVGSFVCLVAVGEFVILRLAC